MKRTKRTRKIGSVICAAQAGQGREAFHWRRSCRNENRDGHVRKEAHHHEIASFLAVPADRNHGSVPRVQRAVPDLDRSCGFRCCP